MNVVSIIKTTVVPASAAVSQTNPLVNFSNRSDDSRILRIFSYNSGEIPAPCGGAPIHCFFNLMLIHVLAKGALFTKYRLFKKSALC